jgi:hypothetical protein
MVKGFERSANQLSQSTINVIRMNNQKSSSGGTTVVNNYHDCNKQFRVVEAFGVVM